MLPNRRAVLLGVGRRALPTLPLAAGAKVMFFGHSFVGNSSFTGTSNGVDPPHNSIACRMIGDDAWTRALDQRFNIDAWADYNTPYPNSGAPVTGGINGALQGCGGAQFPFTSVAIPGITPRTPYMIARRPDIVCLIGGINDFIFVGSMTAAQLIARYEPVLNEFRNAGIWVVADTIAPVSSVQIPDADPRLAEIDVFNAWLIAQEALRVGLKVHDISSVYGVGSGRPNANTVQADGLHPQERGVYAASLSRLTILQAMVSAGTYYNTDPTVTNLMPDNGMLGTGGTKGAGITGDVATNYAATIQTGISTVVASKEAINGSYDKQVFTITPNADANANHALRLTKTASVTTASLGLAEGDWLVALMYIELSASDFWTRASWSVFLAQSTTPKWTTTIFRNNSLNTYVLPTGGIAFWSISNPFQIPSGMSIDTLRVNGAAAMLDLQWKGAATGTPVCKISQPIIRKISDPRTAWHLP